ncbi:hypothetical protein NC651_001105 [Populus alba x Populus x berolinensis]|nr:hypothetical protein NC651_001105 [Populus alba x Populus x berolinensis]
MEYHFTQILQPCWGGHESGKLGEEYSKGIPSNHLPYIQQVPGGRFPELNVCSNDYPTKDGNGAFEKASDQVVRVFTINSVFRKSLSSYAQTEKAEEELGWKILRAKYGRRGDVQRTMLMG